MENELNYEVTSSSGTYDNDNYYDDEEKDIPGYFEYYFVEPYFKHYSDFEGKMSRRQYWLSFLWYYLVLFFIPVIGFFIAIACIIPSIANDIRRLHDIGKSGWYWILSIFPPLNIYLLVLLCKKGETPNQETRCKLADKIIFGIMGLTFITTIVWMVLDY